MSNIKELSDIIVSVKLTVHDLKTCKPISFFKMIGAAYTDYGRCKPEVLDEKLDRHKDIKIISTLIENASQFKAIVLGCGYVVAFYEDDSRGAVAWTDSAVVKAIEDLYLLL